MAKIISQSEKTQNALKNFFIPSAAEAVLLFVLGTVLFLLYNISQIIYWIDTKYLGLETVKINLTTVGQSLSKSFDSAFGGRLGQIIIWSLVGALSYILIWFLKNILNSFENDVIVDHYLHPTNYDRGGYWGSAMAGKVFFGVWLILLLSFSSFAVIVIMPGITSLTGTNLYNFQLPQSPLYLFVCILVPTVIIYIWTRIARIAAHLWALL